MTSERIKQSCDLYAAHTSTEWAKQGRGFQTRRISAKYKEVENTYSLWVVVMIGDETFYYLHEEGELKGVVLTHVDDWILARDSQFIERIRIGITDVLTVSKVEI